MGAVSGIQDHSIPGQRWGLEIVDEWESFGWCPKGAGLRAAGLAGLADLVECLRRGRKVYVST
jgi:hypothetical protein